MTLYLNPYLGKGLAAQSTGDAQWDAYRWTDDGNAAVAGLLALCPAHRETPMTNSADLVGLARVSIKDESKRMNLGSFKALGAAYVLALRARDARTKRGGEWSSALSGKSYVTSSAGNHGLSLAAGARVFGANAIVVLAETVPSSFANRLRAMGAQVVIHGQDYAASMTRAQAIVDEQGAELVLDTAWPDYADIPWLIMQGYAQCAAECVDQLGADVPTKIFLQAGVGGLAGSAAAVFRRAWGDAPEIYVVEPDRAPALVESVRAAKCTYADGPVSNMGRLDCKEPSLIALKSLARDASGFITISDQAAVDSTNALMAATGIASTPSGTAGLAGACSGLVEISANDHVLVIVSEGAD